MKVETTTVITLDNKIQLRRDDIYVVFDCGHGNDIVCNAAELVHALEFLVPSKEYTGWVIENRPPLPEGEIYVEETQVVDSPEVAVEVAMEQPRIAAAREHMVLLNKSCYWKRDIAIEHICRVYLLPFTVVSALADEHSWLR